MYSSLAQPNSESSLSCLGVLGQGSTNTELAQPSDLANEGELSSNSVVGKSKHLALGDYCPDPASEVEESEQVLLGKLGLVPDLDMVKCLIEIGSGIEMGSCLSGEMVSWIVVCLAESTMEGATGESGSSEHMGSPQGLMEEEDSKFLGWPLLMDSSGGLVRG